MQGHDTAVKIPAWWTSFGGGQRGQTFEWGTAAP